MNAAELYDAEVKYAEIRRKDWEKGKLLAKGKDAQYIKTRHGHKVTYLVHPDLGFPVKAMQQFIHELPPGAHSGSHRHLCEAIIHIIKGKGYTVIDGKRYNWEQGDSLVVPPMAWHQHFNPSPTENAAFLGTTTVPLMMNMGFFNMEQQKEIE